MHRLGRLLQDQTQQAAFGPRVRTVAHKRQPGAGHRDRAALTCQRAHVDHGHWHATPVQHARDPRRRTGHLLEGAQAQHFDHVRRIQRIAVFADAKQQIKPPRRGKRGAGLGRRRR
ncbi:hypothetical protein G6F35_017326 [Rhizopus arrhizus]|nr:hypothetical protein G6F35_017326 [Rhizopus arrhizus]